MKKIIAMLLALVMAFALCACGQSAAPAASDAAPVAADSFKVGFIFLHDENSTYDLNFMNAARAACEALGLSEDQYIFKTNIPASQECQEAAEELADAGCNIIFADSFGHEPYMIAAAKEYPEVQFCHSTGTRAHTEGLANYHNAFASIYEGRYLAEVLSGYTSFFLGARSVCPTVTMEVTFTGSWYDETAEKEAANTLISSGCKLISQHADSMGAPTACETAGVPNVSYNGSTLAACPNTFIVSSRIDWTPYYVYAMTACRSGETIDVDWTGDLATGSVVLTDVNEKVAAAGTAEKIAEVTAALEAGELHVFDTSSFTVDSKTVTSYMADVDTDEAYTGDTEVVSDGYFHESEYRSAPYFDLRIDGITLLDEA